MGTKRRETQAQGWGRGRGDQGQGRFLKTGRLPFKPVLRQITMGQPEDGELGSVTLVQRCVEV